jgi:hypothetical protein
MELKVKYRRPKGLHRETNRHGKTVYYFRNGHELRLRLDGDYGSDEFWKSYALAASGVVRNNRPAPYETREQRNRRREMSLCLRRALPAAKQRAAKRHLPFDLTEEWALEQIKRQDFKCALTGILFQAEDDDPGRLRAYAPSLDRIDCSKGYTIDNVRIVIVAINIMLLDWGEEIFHRVAKAYRHVHSG